MGGVVKAVGSFLTGGIVGGVANLLFGGKKAKEQVPVLAPRRDQAREQALERDRVSKRRGVAANMILGAGGAESSTGSGGKTALGS